MSRLGLHTGDWVLVTSPARPDLLSTDGLSTIAAVRTLAKMRLNAVLYTCSTSDQPLVNKPSAPHIFRYEGSRAHRRQDLQTIANNHMAEVREPPIFAKGPFKAVFVTGPLTADRILPDIEAVFGDGLPRVANFHSSVEARMARDERPIDATDTVLLPPRINWKDQLYPLLNFDSVIVDREDEAQRLIRELTDLLLRSGLTSHRIVNTQLKLRRMSALPSDPAELEKMLPIFTAPLPPAHVIRDEGKTHVA